jgi:hypothetical protein
MGRRGSGRAPAHAHTAWARHAQDRTGPSRHRRLARVAEAEAMEDEFADIHKLQELGIGAGGAAGAARAAV